ncbi:helix-turn-helix domain-containing protein [Candidatus Cetobacterium colombiensis]|uniref:Helix-turn-helix domain-containing protein n=1 Tax=Candidatus Cetobacterium colombiensis TaxID=3073100 RepID=A0ABU4WD11_9FUSO|nr:helix-turn-helix domain-containing protein [Candidatus Cetobacterium colombiensis]MDX8337406.1 helix-turn-helix domain-containing protein [Candidatus Cetobacterium colombiensis]
MKKYNLAFRFRIYPNEVQTNLILQTFGCVRFVYNKILVKADEIYKLEGKNKIITPASLKSEFPFLKEVDSLALANAQMNVKTARKSYSTNSVNNSIRIESTFLKLPKLGLVKAKFHRNIPQNYVIKSATISQEPNGAFYVSILTEFQKVIVPVPSDNNIVGLDFSMKELFVSSVLTASFFWFFLTLVGKNPLHSAEKPTIYYTTNRRLLLLF